MKNKLFCTFSSKEDITEVTDLIRSSYTILYDKIFVLEVERGFPGEELACTYNVDSTNLSDVKVVPNTILLHRKKETNTLYTINALIFIAESDPRIDLSRKIFPWEEYPNCILVISNGELVRMNTKIYQKISL